MANADHAEDDDLKRDKTCGEVTAGGSADQPAAAAAASSATPRGADAVTVACSIPSFAAASALLSAPYSCLVANTHRRHVGLSPMYLYRKRTGLRLELDAELLKFSPSLKGVPLAYDDIRIVNRHGDIHDDSGYIHMDVEANFIVFQPEEGQKLLGRVNKLGVGHVGCLVHGCFNASIPKPHLLPVETWRDFGPRVGVDLEFEVTALDADTAGVILIRGRLDRTRVQELLAVSESSESVVTEDQPEPPEMESKPESTEESADLPPKKKKKKKKDKVKEEETEVELTSSPELNGTVGETNGSEAGGKKKKKKKKDKRLKEEEEEEAVVSPKEVHGSDSSGYLSDRPSKKRKHETGTDVLSNITEDLEPKGKKRKKEEGKQH